MKKATTFEDLVIAAERTTRKESNHEQNIIQQ